jgi:tRNA(adenine34) deaminase
MNDENWMKYALDLAERAEREGEVPVGAVIVENNEIIGEGWNRPVTTNDPTAHAEMVALRAAAGIKANYRLPGTTLYVTLEPCVMCCGAIFHARVGRVVFGAYDPKGGAAGSLLNLFDENRLNHHATVDGGIMEYDCARLMTSFFEKRRS